jgi:hypothetical protein
MINHYGLVKPEGYCGNETAATMLETSSATGVRQHR